MLGGWHAKALYSGNRRCRRGESAALARRAMEAGNPLPPVWRQGHAVFRPGASDTCDYTKDARATVESDGGRWHCSANIVSASAAESGIPSDEVGPISMPCARCHPKMGGSSPNTQVALGISHEFFKPTTNPQFDVPCVKRGDAYQA